MQTERELTQEREEKLQSDLQKTVDGMNSDDKVNLLKIFMAIGGEQLSDGRYAATEAQLISFVSLCMASALEQAGIDVKALP